MKYPNINNMGATGVDVSQNTLTGLDTDVGSTPTASNIYFIKLPPYLSYSLNTTHNPISYIVAASLMFCALRCRCDQIIRRRFIRGVFLSVSYLSYLTLIPPPSLKFSSSSAGWLNSISRALGKAVYLHILEKFYLHLYNCLELNLRMIII